MVRLSAIEDTLVIRPIFLCHVRRTARDPGVEYVLDQVRRLSPAAAVEAPPG